MRILVADDDAAVRDTLADALRRADFQVDTVADGEAALAAARAARYDLLLLNAMMPRLCGTDVLRELQPESDTPVVLLTARATTEERVRGLELGADDCVTKPFRMDELISRLRAILRRRELDRRAYPLVRRVGPLEIDYARGEVSAAGEPVLLTRSEYRLLALLAEQPGETVTRRAIMQHLWRSPFVRDERGADMHVSNLRRKLGRDVIETVRGVGYRLAPSR
ncbi:MAG TPA: response regulator transcription factor [Gaiellaceae bacterium]|jgi:DNA-binding response OmpR family regulator|nr:response regulator transcription factor [Gaiellaceae bacterium]